MNKHASISHFGKHAGLIVHEQQPFNAGPPLELQRQHFVTPKEVFFVRNHGAVPEVEPDDYYLTVDGLVQQPLRLSLDDIQRQFSKITVMATIQCAGNRRSELMAIAPIAGETAWSTDAMSNGTWGGAPLREILREAGVAADALHVAFVGLDEVVKQGRRFNFGGSIAVEKALRPEVLVAYEMNGAPLPPVHGFPLRVVVPGYIGARSVKWLSRITVQASPSDNYYQAHAYKLFPPQTRAETADWERGLMLGELSVNSVICRPLQGERLPAGPVVVQGYAMAGGGRYIERVDVSCDQGRSWITAELAEQPQPWAWRFWEAQLVLPPGPCQIVARAWDSASNTQPEDAGKIWNFKGYMNNAWYRVDVTIE